LPEIKTTPNKLLKFGAMVKMSTKRDYIQTLRERYIKAKTRKEKTLIINEVEANLKKERKYIIRVLNGKYYRKRRKATKRPEVYTYDLSKPLKQIWIVAGKKSSKNLKPQIPELIKKLKQFDEIVLYEKQERLLCQMSTYTIDRLLNYVRKRTKIKGLGGTKKSPLLKTLIPIRTSFDDVHEAGHVEQDCVLHCGSSVAGTYAETLNTMDIHTHWNEQTAILKKTTKKVIAAFHEQRKRFPFVIKSTDFDNGFEFVNWYMHGYCKKEGIDFTRSRSYRKNDQAHIEGKNFESIRQVIGYDRITQQDIVDLINDIYSNEFRLLNNFFYATRKLKSRQKNGGKMTKKYDEAKTPYKRVLLDKTVSLKVKGELMQIYKKLNPAELDRNLSIKLAKLKKMISVSEINLASSPTVE
jgi:hypothetical protein